MNVIVEIVEIDRSTLIYQSFSRKIRKNKTALALATRDRGHWPLLVFSIVPDIVNISAGHLSLPCLLYLLTTLCTIMPLATILTYNNVGWNEERERDNEATEKRGGGKEEEEEEEG